MSLSSKPAEANVIGAECQNDSGDSIAIACLLRKLGHQRLGELRYPSPLLGRYRNGTTTRRTNLSDGCVRSSARQTQKTNRDQGRSPNALPAMNGNVLHVRQVLDKY